MVEELEQQAADLRNLYWFIRLSRRTSERRRYYRIAHKEKARLAGLGFDQELIRLYCLCLANPKREGRYRRLKEYANRMTQLAFDFG
jgi:hypothetical protein